MKKALIAVVCILLVGGCGSGNDNDGATATDGARATDGDGGPAATPRIRAAARGTVNVPKAGSYTYEYTSERTNASDPEATPVRSEDDATLTSRVTVDDNVVVNADKTTEGPAVATVTRRYADDGIYDVSFETESPQGTAGCTFDEPILIFPLPPKEQELDPQPFEGAGSSCDGERTITIEGRENVQDADGTTWSTWKIVQRNTVRSTVGITSRNTLTMWFSPDLGKEIKLEGVTEAVTSNDEVAARGESTQLLTSYPR